MSPTPIHGHPAAGPAAGDRPPDARALFTFATVAVGVAGLLFWVSTVAHPGGPFLLAGVFLGLVLPALALTRAEAGRDGVRSLLRDVVRLPVARRWWLLPLAAFGLPAVSWVVATVAAQSSASGGGSGGTGGRPLTWTLLAAYVVDLAVTALLVNLWEELAWTGYFQRRAMQGWGEARGCLVTAAFFTAVHVPLAVSGAGSTGRAAMNVLVVAMAGTALRFLIGRLDRRSGGSLLAAGVLHASFNATEVVLEPAYDGVRVAAMVAAAVVVVGFLRGRD